MVFHHSGLTSSQALKFEKLDANGIKDLLHIFLAILSWKTVVDAGLPIWCNDSNMILPGEKGPQAVQVKKVLHHTLSLRGRCARVVLVCEVDKSNKRNESKSNLTIPAPESMCAPRRSARLQSQKAVGKPGLYLPSSYLEYVCLPFHIQPRTRNLCPRRQPVRFLLPFCVGIYLVISSLKIAT